MRAVIDDCLVAVIPTEENGRLNALDAGKPDLDLSIDFSNCTAPEDGRKFRMPSEDAPVAAVVWRLHAAKDREQADGIAW